MPQNGHLGSREDTLCAFHMHSDDSSQTIPGVASPKCPPDPSAAARAEVGGPGMCLFTPELLQFTAQSTNVRTDGHWSHASLSCTGWGEEMALVLLPLYRWDNISREKGHQLVGVTPSAAAAESARDGELQLLNWLTINKLYFWGFFIIINSSSAWTFLPGNSQDWKSLQDSCTQMLCLSGARSLELLGS